MYWKIIPKGGETLNCPFCKSIDTKVTDSRPIDEKQAIRRRRECEECGKRFTTYERLETMPIMVIKKDNTIEAFDRNKLLNGLIKACNKRPISIQQMEDLIDDIENSLYNGYNMEVESSKLGEMVMDRLKDIDEIAYVRFASVYKQFKDVDSFMTELAGLLNSKK